MKLRRRPREEPEINVISLVDVMLLLVIFFMLSTTFNRPTNIQVELPKASTDAKVQDTAKLEISIDADGGFYVNQTKVTSASPDALKQAVSVAAGSEREQPFVINADAHAPTQAAVTAMDVAGQLGFKHISIATQKPAAGGP